MRRLLFAHRTLYHESIASGDALAYSQMYSSPEEHREAYNVLYPAYGTYVGSALGTGIPKYASPSTTAASSVGTSGAERNHHSSREELAVGSWQ